MYFFVKGRQQRQSSVPQKTLLLAKNLSIFVSIILPMGYVEPNISVSAFFGTVAAILFGGFSDSEHYQPGFILFQIK